VRPRLEIVESSQPLEITRDTPVVVVIPVYGTSELFERCLRSVIRNTPSDVELLVGDEGSSDESPANILRHLETERVDRRIHLLRQSRYVGFPKNVDAAFVATAPGDVVILDSACEVGPEWLQRLRAAAQSDSLIATASALTSSGAILTVPRSDDPRLALSAGHDIDSAARAVASASLRIRPRIPGCVGPCVYIRRPAIELAGDFGEGEEVDFWLRCSLRGLVHVAADDVYVFHAGGVSPGSRTRADNEQPIRSPCPSRDWSVGSLAQRQAGPLARALSIAEVALTGLSVTIDARCLGASMTGTQVIVLELIRCLARTGKVRLRVLVPPDTADDVLAEFRGLGIELLLSDKVPDDVEPFEIVHRPYQVAHVSELELLEQLGRRLVVSHLDLIAFRTPDYVRSPLDWLEFQHLTRSVLALADAVIFISRHAAEDAIVEELVEPSRARVVYPGIGDPTGNPEKRPAELPADVEAGYLLYVGTDYRHKNRLFALELLEQLAARHGWTGRLVFAGPRAASGTSGTSEAEEAAFLAGHGELASRTVHLGQVSDSEKAWLYRRCAAVIYPTVYEGFGLIPFEAAAYGRPSFFAPQTALAETLAGCATLIPWDAAASADAVCSILSDEAAAHALTTSIARIGAAFTPEAMTEGVISVYAEVVGLRPRDLRVAHAGTSADSIASMSSALSYAGLSPTARRALLSALARKPIRTILIGPLELAFTLSYLVKHGHRPDRRGI
jgi:glycosyltransferase involved in cell wall biosynthesis/GT2 family glycosyltransferase